MPYSTESNSITNVLFGNQPKYGQLALSNEKQRQALINQGLQQINTIFGGGTVPFYTQASGTFTPSNQYYSLTGKGFKPYQLPGRAPSSTTGWDTAQLGIGAFGAMGVPGAIEHIRHGNVKDSVASILSGGASDFFPLFAGLFGDKPLTPLQQEKQAFNKGKLYTSEDKTFTGFGPDFYAQRAKAYEDFALPQLARQYQENRNAMLYGLNNRGLSNSSVANLANSNLQKDLGQARQTIADTAMGQSQELQREVEAARQSSIAQLYQTGDPSQAIQSAISTIGGFQEPGVFAPLSNMFSNLANSYVTRQILNNYRTGGGSGNNMYSFLGGLPSSPTY